MGPAKCLMNSEVIIMSGDHWDYLTGEDETKSEEEKE